MVRVFPTTHNKALAWRVRDALARHPLLGGGMAHIEIDAQVEVVILQGWVMDAKLGHTALQLARRAAGSRPVQTRLVVREPGESSPAGLAASPAPSSQGEPGESRPQEEPWDELRRRLSPGSDPESPWHVG